MRVPIERAQGLRFGSLSPLEVIIKKDDIMIERPNAHLLLTRGQVEGIARLPDRRAREMDDGRARARRNTCTACAVRRAA